MYCIMKYDFADVTKPTYCIAAILPESALCWAIDSKVSIRS